MPLAIVETQTVKVPESTKVIPEYIVYPDGRLTIDSGILTKSAVVIVTLQVLDRDGLSLMEDKTFKTDFAEYPDDIKKEVLGAVTISFAESNKPTAEPIVEELIGD